MYQVIDRISGDILFQSSDANHATEVYRWYSQRLDSIGYIARPAR